MPEKKSPHILNTSSNLLGFCLVVLTSIKVSRFSTGTIIDEIAGVAAVFLVVSSIFSFLSIRTNNEERGNRMERAADILFLIGLVSIALTVILVSFDLFT